MIAIIKKYAAAACILTAVCMAFAPHDSDAAGYESYVGSICLWPLSWAPEGWLLCQGQELPISAYAPLYSIIGTTFGGDGRTTFALPDLRGRTVLGFGRGPGLSSYAWGQTGGTATTALASAQSPVAAGAVGISADSFTDSGASVVVASADGISGETQPATLGSGQLHSNMQPYMGLNYIICVNGMYPPRQ